MTACRSCAIVMIALVVLLNLLPVYKTNHFTRTNTRSDDVHWDCSSDDTSRRQQLLAYQHSFGYFRDIPNSEWEQHYIARAIQSQPHYRYPHDHDRYTSTNQSASWIFSNWDPYFTCPHVRKIGGLDGGAKWICDIDRLRTVIERRRHVHDEFWTPPQSFVVPADDVPVHAQKGVVHTAHCLIYSIGSSGNMFGKMPCIRR
jgi:Methyltransferase domain